MHLLSLPWEVRDLIFRQVYDDLLPFGDHRHLRYWGPCKRGGKARWRSRCAWDVTAERGWYDNLFHVCQQFYKECLPIFYEKFEVEFCQRRAIPALLRSKPMLKAGSVRWIRLGGLLRDDRMVSLEYLSTLFPNLRYLTFGPYTERDLRPYLNVDDPARPSNLDYVNAIKSRFPRCDLEQPDRLGALQVFVELQLHYSKTCDQQWESISGPMDGDRGVVTLLMLFSPKIPRHVKVLRIPEGEINPWAARQFLMDGESSVTIDANDFVFTKVCQGSRCRLCRSWGITIEDIDTS